MSHFANSKDKLTLTHTARHREVSKNIIAQPLSLAKTWTAFVVLKLGFWGGWMCVRTETVNEFETETWPASDHLLPSGIIYKHTNQWQLFWWQMKRARGETLTPQASGPRVLSSRLQSIHLWTRSKTGEQRRTERHHGCALQSQGCPSCPVTILNWVKSKSELDVHLIIIVWVLHSNLPCGSNGGRRMNTCTHQDTGKNIFIFR